MGENSTIEWTDHSLWMKGTSLGALTGELKTVLDAHNERQIILVPPVGPEFVQCNFTEALRELIRDNLFKFVRVTGTLHYAEKSPFPYLVDLSDIEPLGDEHERPHLSEGRGLFRDSQYELETLDWHSAHHIADRERDGAGRLLDGREWNEFPALRKGEAG